MEVQVGRESQYPTIWGWVRWQAQGVGKGQEWYCEVLILSTAIKKAMETDELKCKMDEMALEQRYMDSAQFTTFLDDTERNIKPFVDLKFELTK